MNQSPRVQTRTFRVLYRCFLLLCSWTRVHQSAPLLLATFSCGLMAAGVCVCMYVCFICACVYALVCVWTFNTRYRWQECACWAWRSAFLILERWSCRLRTPQPSPPSSPSCRRLSWCSLKRDTGSREWLRSWDTDRMKDQLVQTERV